MTPLALSVWPDEHPTDTANLGSLEMASCFGPTNTANLGSQGLGSAVALTV